MAIIPIVFTVTPKGIDPAGVVRAGHVGDHNAAEVTFEISPELLNPNYLYHIEYIDPQLNWDTTPDVSLTTGENTIVKSITNAWTIHPGTALIRIVIKQLPDLLTIYSADGKLYFEAVEKGNEQIVEPTYETGLTQITRDAQAATDAANQAAANLETIDCYREA